MANIVKLAVDNKRLPLPVCATCAYYKRRDRWSTFPLCEAVGGVWAMRAYQEVYYCNRGQLWEPKPPKRSLWERLFGRRK